MTEFKVTRSFAQELCVDGSVQALGYQLINEADTLDRSAFGTPDISKRRFTPDNRPAPAHLQPLIPIFEDIAVLSNGLERGTFCIDMIAQILKSKAREPKKPRSYTEDDFHIDGTFGDTIASALISLSGASDEKLVTAGRADNPDLTTLKYMYFKNGMILLAGFELGSAIQPPLMELGDTYHEGYRSEPGELLVVDGIIRTL